MLGSPAGPGGPSQRGLWPLAPAPSATSFATDGFSKCGVYSLFPGGPSFGSALYSHASTIGRFASSHIQQSGNPFHTTHKVADSLFSSTGYTFGAPTPPPGSPYSPVPVTQLELLTKGFNSNIIIQQPDYPISPRKLPQDKRCDEKCCSLKPQKPCDCQLGSPVKKFSENGGCSRTNPIEWSGINVKKEPNSTPCQVAEISTSDSPVIKLEVTSPRNNDHCPNSIFNHNGNNIPIGIAVARQRFQQEIVGSPSLPPTGLLTTVNAAAQIKEVARISEIVESTTAAGMAANTTGGAATGGTLLQCTDDRSAPLAGWSVGGTQNSTLAAPTLWQYPAPVPMEPMVPLPVPMPPVGFQLVRDPTTGSFLLLPTTGIESLQQAVVWPGYHQPPSVLLPPLPPPPLQLLSSASSDYLSSSTTLHQHTQTHSTRLVAVTTDNKRKIPLPIPTTTLIKIETDATLDQTKTLQAVSTIASNTGTVFTDQNVGPLVATHVIYQHPTTNLILSQANSDTICRSQATSPVTSCLTPPPETVSIHEDDHHLLPIQTVQDASNQTDTPICSEDDTIQEAPTAEILGVAAEPKSEIRNQYEEKNQNVSDITSVPNIAIEEPPQKQIESENIQDGDKSKPDLSGLELLSNSIVEFESCRNNVKQPQRDVLTAIAHMTLKDGECGSKEQSVTIPQTVNDNLGGLDLLCALAEQRILEEKVEKKQNRERKREKRKSKRHPDEPRSKKNKSDKCSSDRGSASDTLIESSDTLINESSDNNKNRCSCFEEKYRSYKTPESEEEVKKFIASKTQSGCCKGDWPCMNEMELDMRMKLADLQRQYREKQKELSKLKPKKHECSKKRSRKKSDHSERSSTPPLPLVDKIEVQKTPINNNNVSNINNNNNNNNNTKNNHQELLKPPTLCAFEQVKTPKLEAIKQSDRIIANYRLELLREQQAQEDLESSPEKNSSSKKRKVGRPKKLLSSSGFNVQTETIVAKKPKNIVGYLLAAKEKLKLQSTYRNSPPKYLDDTTIAVKAKKSKINNDEIEEVKSKIRPKLKAEATVKTYEDDDHQLADDEMEEEEEVNENIEEEVEEVEEKTNEKVEEENENEHEDDNKASVESVCTLTSQHLEVGKLRVLTAMGGLFYAGHLNAVEPPDVYSITLDGERGNRPHIMSREEILRDAIVEVSPKSIEELRAGTRLCAYWSQQYRCLYPGSVAEPGTPDPLLDSKFVAVEFDDGDNGRIALDDIRLLPPDYPIIEYDPNPLLSLSKRRRRTSTSVSTELRILSSPPQDTQIPPAKDLDLEKENKDTNKPSTDSTDLHKERKRLKKKKREKLKQKLLHEDKKKRKKHRCNDEYCKHKKHHKKHRKHKKHHHYVKEKEVAIVPATIEEKNKMEEQEENVEVVADEAKIEEIVANPEDEVTMDDILEVTQSETSKKFRDRQESCESRSKMSAFLPARQLWGWSGKGYKRPRAKGRSRKQFFKSIQRGKETITVGDAAVFLSTGRPDRPYIGRIEAMWEYCGKMAVKVKWFYHPEETTGCPLNLEYPGALFESPHVDENDVQTISHKCEVLPFKEYRERLGDDPESYATIYDNNDIYYLSGTYDPFLKVLKMKPEIPFSKTD